MLQMHGMPIGFLLWSSFAFSMVAMSQHDWIKYGNYKEGLFVRMSTTVPPEIPPVKPLGL